MCVLQSKFWMGKNESLAQDLIGEIVKTILIGLLALFVMEYAKSVIQVYEKRRALVTFQNSTVEGAIQKLQMEYVAKFGCVGSVGQFELAECLNGLELLRVELDRQNDLISSVLGKSVTAFEPLMLSVDGLVAAHGNKQTSVTLAKTANAAKENVRSLIKELAKEIQ